VVCSAELGLGKGVQEGASDGDAGSDDAEIIHCDKTYWPIPTVQTRMMLSV